MQEYIRRFNYISDFYWTQNEWAAHLNAAAYPVSYYKVDWENSVYDKDLMAASYEKYGVGEMSGIVYKQIQMVPVYHVEQVTPTPTADEKGLTLADSELLSIVIPSEYNLMPTEWDFIHFSQKFMFKGSDSSPVFVVKGTEPSTYGNINYIKLHL